MPFKKIYRLKQPEDPEDKGLENFDAEIIFFKGIKARPFLTREEEVELVQKTRNKKRPKEAKEALATLVEHNLRFILSKAQKYHQIFHLSSFTILDFAQTGIIGFIKGVQRFDIARGVRLLTYAGWWIYQEIIRRLGEEGFIISHPYNWKDKESGETFLFKDLKLARSMIFLDKETIEGGDVSLEGVIADPAIPAIEERLEFVRQAVEKIIKETRLNKRETFILEHRLLAHQPLTLKQCSALLQVTRERVRQVEVKLKQKLRRAAWRLGIKNVSTVLK